MLLQRPFRTLAFFVVLPMTLERMSTDLKLDDAQRDKVKDFLRVRREKFIELVDSAPAAEPDAEPPGARRAAPRRARARRSPRPRTRRLARAAGLDRPRRSLGMAPWRPAFSSSTMKSTPARACSRRSPRTTT